MSPSMQSVPQEAEFTLESGLKIRTFRKDPAKFFIEIEKWMQSLNVGAIERMAITGDGAGYLTLVIAYRETKSVLKDRSLQYDMLSLLADLAESVEHIAHRVIPQAPAKSHSESGDALPAN